MNKKIGIIAGVVVVLILGIVGLFALLGSKNPQASQESTVNKESGQSKSAFESLEDVFTNKSLTLACKFTSEEGPKTTIYVKNGMVRTSSMGNNPLESSDAIIRDNFIYFWNDKSAVKVPFNPEDMESTQQNAQTKQSLSDLEKYKDSCKTAVVNDSFFTPPSDVEFQDLSNFMQAMPTGTSESGNTPSQEEIEALMKQYQQ